MQRQFIFTRYESRDAWVALFSAPYFLKFYAEKNPELEFVESFADLRNLR